MTLVNLDEIITILKRLDDVPESTFRGTETYSCADAAEFLVAWSKGRPTEFDKDIPKFAVREVLEDRHRYLLRFLRGCATAADKKELGVDMQLLLVNGDLMRECADEFEKLAVKGG